MAIVPPAPARPASVEAIGPPAPPVRIITEIEPARVAPTPPARPLSHASATTLGVPPPEEPLAVDELGLELAYGLGRLEAETEDDMAVEPLFRADVVPGGDEETLLPFVMPTGAAVAVPEPRREKAPAPPPPWFERFFDNDYLELEPQPSARTTKREVDFAIACFNLAQGARILDLCCGVGRHTLDLAARGYEVVGLDLSRAMLERSVQESRARKLAVDFVHGDVRSLAFRRLFDGVLFWGTSFGYFRDVENALVLRKVAQALRPGGRVLLQIANRDFVLRDLPRTQWRRVGDALILDEVDFDWRSSRFRLRRSVLRADGRERIDTLDFRGYALHELLELLSAEGFVPLEVSGRISNRGAYFGAESPSIIVLAEIR
jgi:SAM-dependent methyltransferase